MKKYTIKFNNPKTYYELFESVIDGLNFPSWCGKNLDAIWDLLTTDIDVPAVIFIENSKTISKSLEENYKQLLELFDEAVMWYKDNNMYLEIKISN